MCFTTLIPGVKIYNFYPAKQQFNKGFRLSLVDKPLLCISYRTLDTFVQSQIARECSLAKSCKFAAIPCSKLPVSLVSHRCTLFHRAARAVRTVAFEISIKLFPYLRRSRKDFERDLPTEKNNYNQQLGCGACLFYDVGLTFVNIWIVSCCVL